MKNKLKRLRLLSLFVTTIFVISCEKNEDLNSVSNHHNHSLHKDVKISQTPFQTLLKEQGFNRGFEKISKIRGKKNSELGIMNRSSMEDQYGFTITNPMVTVLTTPTITSYTLHITPDEGISNSKFQNLVIEINNINESRAVVLEYIKAPLSNTSATASAGVELEEVLYDDINKIAYSSVQLDNGCIQTTIFECNNPAATHEPGGPGCWAQALILTACPDLGGGGGGASGGSGTGSGSGSSGSGASGGSSGSGGGTSGSGGGGSGSTGGYGGSGGGSSTSGTGIITSTTLDPETLGIKNFIRSLSTAQSTWYFSQSQATQNNINQSLNTLGSNGEVISASNIRELIDLAISLNLDNETDFNEQNILALNITLSLVNSNNIPNFGTPNVNTLIENQLIQSDPGFGAGTAGFMVRYNALVLQESAVIASTYPQGHQFTYWEIVKIIFQAQSEVIHLGLDVLGMTPGVGPIFDVTHGVWYAFSGDLVNSGISFAAAVPFAGDWTTVARITKRVYNLSNGAGKVILKAYKLADGSIVFSNRNQLRKILGITNSAIHAHHIIPYGLSSHNLVQLAAKFTSATKKAWHPNDIANGIAIPADFHLNGHSIYINKVRARMDELFLQANGDMELAYDYLVQYMTQIHNIIAANPNLTLGQIADLIP